VGAIISWNRVAVSAKRKKRGLQIDLLMLMGRGLILSRHVIAIGSLDFRFSAE
jgi:hypothetical protein